MEGAEGALGAPMQLRLSWRSRWNALRPFVQAAVGVVLLLLWARSVSLPDLWQHARPRHLLPIAGILLFALASAWLRSWRWALLLRPVARLSTRDAFWMNAGGGLVNYLIPIRAGEAARVVWLRKRHSVLAGTGLATVLVDKTFDLAAVAIVMGLAALLQTYLARGTASTRGLLAAALGACTLLAVLVALATVGPKLARSGLVARVLPSRWAAAVGSHAFSFRVGATAASGPSRLAGLGAISLGALAVDAAAFGLLFWALDAQVPLLAVLLGYSALLLTYVLPSTPGYVGSLEVAGSLILVAGIGLQPAVAAGAIVLWHALQAISVLGVGLVGLRLLGRQRRPAQERLPRVAVFHCGFTYSGGGERIVLEEVMGLRRLGYEVECYAPTVDAKACYPDLLPAVDVHSLLPQLPSWVPLRDAVHMITCSVLVPLYAWRFRSFDIFLGCNQPGAWIAFWVARIQRRPYMVYLNQPNRIVHPRGIDLETGWQVNSDYHILFSLLKRALGFVAWADQVSVRSAACLLVNGHYIGDIIRATYGREATDCPAGCHVPSGPPLPIAQRALGELTINGQRLRKPYVLLTNRHYPQKRFDLAIQAIKAVSLTQPTVRLVVPGPTTSHTEELRDLVGELGLTGKVLFLGAVTEVELQRLYAEASVYIYPAPEEDFGMGVIEAMASGVPVVAWNRAGPTVTVLHGETGYLARPGDVEDYARGILSFLSEPRDNHATGLRAHARAIFFSWERHVSILEGAMADLLGTPARAERPDRLPIEEQRVGAYALESISS